MLRRVFVDGYKSLKNVELKVQPLTVVIGPNASGKSNLFDALRLLSRIVTSRSLSDAFGDHRGDPLEAFDYSDEGIEGLLRKDRVQFAIEVDVELSPQVIKETERLIQAYKASTSENGNGAASPRKYITERLLRYRIGVEMIPRTGALKVCDESLWALSEKSGDLYINEHRKAFLERVGDKLRLRMEGRARPTEHELGLNYALASQPLYPPHYPHIIAFREEVARWQFYYFEPRLMREENPVKQTFQLTTFGGDLAAFYYTLQQNNEKQFQNLQKILSSLVPTAKSFTSELTEEGKIRLKIQEEEVYFSAKVISEGTLRLLGLLAILSPTSPATVVGFEEPENGVHPRRLKLIADLLYNASEHKQIIVNTHSHILPDYFNKVYLVQCKKINGQSVFVPLMNAQGVFRKPMVEEALDEEIPLVSEQILRGDWG
ncbi:MAG: AAA family ATPase [Firmicutes bacterium]|nr:AAA family ATPase [Bacillota bacterium]